MDSFGARDYKVKLSADVRHLQMWKLRGLYWQVSANMHNLACKDNNCLDNKSLSTNKLILIAPCAILSSRKNNGGKHGNDKAENMGNNG